MGKATIVSNLGKGHYRISIKYNMTGKITEVPPPELCRMEKAIIRAADRVAGELWTEKNRLFVNRFYEDDKARMAMARCTPSEG